MKYVLEIKSTITGAHEYTDEAHVQYKIKILERGELLFFQQGDHALICAISARFSAIDPQSVKRWDDGRKISDEERATILQKIVDLYQKAYKDDLKILEE